MVKPQCKPLPPFSEKRAVRFWRKVLIGQKEDCWPWQGAFKKTGYGYIRIGKDDYVTSRAAYLLATGRDPYPLDVLHTCVASRLCCNPDHLYLGTDLENARDRKEQGRVKTTPRPGEKHHNAKLTEEQVRQIRIQYAAGRITTDRLGILFGVGGGAVLKIVKRKRWQHIE